MSESRMMTNLIIKADNRPDKCGSMIEELRCPELRWHLRGGPTRCPGLQVCGNTHSFMFRAHIREAQLSSKYRPQSCRRGYFTSTVGQEACLKLVRCVIRAIDSLLQLNLRIAIFVVGASFLPTMCPVRQSGRINIGSSSPEASLDIRLSQWRAGVHCVRTAQQVTHPRFDLLRIFADFSLRC